MSNFDWDSHWELKKEPESAKIFAIKMADRITKFIENKNIRTVADIGCGPATLLFNLARRFQEKWFYGLDIAESIIRKNREKAAKLGIANLFFEQDEIPCLSSGRTYDLVTCFATLHYIREIEYAIKGLFKHVNKGGYMIFNYPNVNTRLAYQKDIGPDDDIMKQRFALVLAGENLLSIRKINDLLGVMPRKFYSSIKSNIYVSVHKK